MSILRCQCGATTNSAVSESWNPATMEDGLARGCYARWVDQRWQYGCRYREADVLMKKMADDLVAKVTGPVGPPADDDDTEP